MTKKQNRKRAYGGFRPRSGALSGWTEYRHGPKAKVTLAPILKGKRREHVVHHVIDALKDWHLSPFEHEADAVHGLRQGFCLQGCAFHQAEADALAIVASGLRIMGAVRPSWEQGQPEYTLPEDACAHCSGPLDSYRQKSRFCSDVCARAFLQRRNDQAMEVGEQTLQKARRLIYKERQPARTCDHCGAAFRPMHGATKARFCSKPCMYAFRDTAAAAVYERSCEWCGSAFRAKLPEARYCQPKCQLRTSQIRLGKVKRITPMVFDYVFKVAA